MRHNRTEKQFLLQSLGMKWIGVVFAITFFLWSDPWSQKSPPKVFLSCLKNNRIQSSAVRVGARSVLSRKLEKPVGNAPKLRDITLPGMFSVHCATRLYKACNELRNPKCYCHSILYRAGQRNACTRLGALEIPWHCILNSLDRD